MKNKRLALPGAAAVLVFLLALGLLDLAGQAKADGLTRRASQAAASGQYTEALEILQQLETTAPQHIPQYALAAGVYLDLGDETAARSALQRGAALTGSAQLAAMAEDLTLVQRPGTQQPGSITLPGGRPDDWLPSAEATPAPASPGALRQVRMDTDFIVRYTRSELDRYVQLSPPSGDTGGWTWRSSNEQVATVTAAGMVSVGSQPGESCITASNGTQQAACWVYVFEPEIYQTNEGYGNNFFTYLEGEFTVTNGGNVSLDELIARTPTRSGSELLPPFTVYANSLSGAAAFGVPGGPSGTRVTDREMGGKLDRDGNPIQDTAALPEAAGTSEPDRGVELRFTWQTVYYSGRFRIPDHLQNDGVRYRVSLVEINTQTFAREISIPAGVEQLTRYYDDGINPFYDDPDLERITVDRANPAYTAVDGVLYTKDMTTLVAYPSAAAATDFSIPEGVQRILPCAFRGNRNLQHLYLPASVQDIGFDAFTGMGSIRQIEVAADNPYLRMEGGIPYSY